MLVQVKISQVPQPISMIIHSISQLLTCFSRRPGFCTVCDFAHARPIMLSILLVKSIVKECDMAALPSGSYFAHARPIMLRILLVLTNTTYYWGERERIRYCACAALRANVAGRIGN